MDKIWLEYVGSRTPGGIGQDYEHTKYYWGPENDWKCEVPVIFAGMIIENMGVDMFMPCLAPGTEQTGPPVELEKAKKDLESANFALQKRENAVKSKEDALDERAKALNERTEEVEKMEKAQDKRDKALIKRENALNKKGKKK